MRKIFVFFLLLLSVANAFGESDTITSEQASKNRYVVWVLPSRAKNIYGIAIGPIGSEAMCGNPYAKYSHGLNLQLFGQGFLPIFYINKLKFVSENIISNDSTKLQDSIPIRAVHNGLLVSPFGTFTPMVNGVSLSAFMSLGETVNGVSANLLWNVYRKINGVSIGVVNTIGKMNGLQIGLINNAHRMRGIQIGLWNKNEKRSLPLINWCWKKKRD